VYPEGINSNPLEDIHPVYRVHSAEGSNAVYNTVERLQTLLFSGEKKT